jgi:hypothetical protein
VGTGTTLLVYTLITGLDLTRARSPKVATKTTNTIRIPRVVSLSAVQEEISVEDVDGRDKEV